MTIKIHHSLSHYCQLALQIILFACLLSGCAYTEKLSSQLLPNSEFNALIVEGDAAMENADWAKASAKYEQAAQLKPRDLDVKMKQAMAFQRAGKLARAHNMYQQIIDEGEQNGSKDAKLVKLAKANQAKFGFKSAPKEPEVAKTEEPTQASAPVLAETTQVKDEPALVEPSVVVEPAKVEVAEPAQVIETQAVISPQAPTEKAESAVPSDTPASVTAIPDNALASITQKISNWVLDWKSKRVDAYFSHYVVDFAGDAANAKAWRKERKHKILSAKNINIEVEGLEIKVIDADNATAHFTQRYQSAGYQDKGEKTLLLKRVADTWLIAGEQFAR